VHTVLGLSNVLLVILISFLALFLLRRLDCWSERRSIPFVVLAMPLTSLGLGISELHHFLGRPCFLSAPTWDELLGTTLLLGVGVIALFGLSLGIVRLALLVRLVSRRGTLTDAALQATASRLAQRRGTTTPRVRLCIYDQPVAFTCGLRRPVILLSTWMVDHLDQQEMEGVLAHELEHVARRDYLVIWLATLLRDAFWYVPTSWAVYRQLQQEKEVVCDEWASRLTNRPLALASALAKVWQHTVAGPAISPAQSLVGVGEDLDRRIGRLLDQPGLPPRKPHSRMAILSVGLLAFVLVLVVAVSGSLILASMGCGPAVQLWKGIF
jgi:Zn-dependent protease with chaperone function